MWRLLYAPFSYLAMTVLTVFLILIGHVIIPIGLYLESFGYEWSWRYQKQYAALLPKWLYYLWNNEGDGLYPPEYKSRYPEWSNFRLAWTWLAVRNPVNNLRFVPFLRCDIDPKKVAWRGTWNTAQMYEPKEQQTYWLFCWCGFYSCLRFQYKRKNVLKELWVGWKIWPIDTKGVSSYRIHGAGFALQWKDL